MAICSLSVVRWTGRSVAIVTFTGFAPDTEKPLNSNLIFETEYLFQNSRQELSPGAGRLTFSVSARLPRNGWAVAFKMHRRRPFRSLWRKSRLLKNISQGLKPRCFLSGICGTTEVVPFQNRTFTTGR
jgi:hypothetical protein